MNWEWRDPDRQLAGRMNKRGGEAQGLVVSASLESDVFCDRYQRNNKLGGVKNLRCFPTCSDRHRVRGYCGRSVFVHVVLRPEGVSMEQLGLLRVVGEFGRCVTEPRFRVGCKVSEVELLPRFRSKEEPMKELLRGELCKAKLDNGTAVFELNRNMKGWHYGWVSNKHTCNSQHCLKVFVFEETGVPGELVCVDQIVSPKFVIFCRRRRRFKVDPRAPISLPRHDRKRPLATNLPPNPPLNKRERPESLDISVTRLNSMLRAVASRIAEVKLVSNEEKTPEEVSVFAKEEPKLVPFGDFDDFPSSTLEEVIQLLSEDGLGVGDDLTSLSLAPLIHDKKSFQKTEEEKQRIVMELAKYLLEETGFTKSIQDLVEPSPARIAHGTEYRSFIKVLQKNVSGFLRKHQLTLDEFDGIFNVPPHQSSDVQRATDEDQFNALCASLGSGGNNDFTCRAPQVEDVGGAFSSLVLSKRISQIKDSFRDWVLASSSSSSSAPSISHSISGSWVLTKEGANEMTELRTRCGIPWILSKMFEYMERTLEILLKDDQFFCGMQRKLLSNGALQVKLDNVERPFGLQLPILTSLSQNWTHRGFIDSQDHSVNIIHTIGFRRMKRRFALDAQDLSKLHISTTLELQVEDGGPFKQEITVRQIAKRSS